MKKIKPLKWHKNRLFIIDQRKLPNKIKWVEINSLKDIVSAIKKLKVRGAPLIGIAAAFGVIISLRKTSKKDIEKRFYFVLDEIAQTRPTAYNLFYALDKMKIVYEANKQLPKKRLLDILLQTAHSLWEEDLVASEKMGIFGSEVLKGKKNILTHCNAGILATGGGGTVMAIIQALYNDDKNIHIWVDETRPLLQGARLTAWELNYLGINHTVIADNMAGFIMSQNKVDAVLIGADRIAANGDVANKIGSYSLSVLAQYHKIPFYVVAPSSTIHSDIAEGKSIPIEERNKKEIMYVNKKYITPKQSSIYNPAFDIVPANLITAIITERGITKPEQILSLINI